MTPIVEHCPIVVIDGAEPLIAGASTITGTAYLRVGDPGVPGGVALILVELAAVERLATALTGLAEQMRALPTTAATPARPVLRAVSG